VQDTTDPAQCPRVEPTRVRDATEACLALRHEFAYTAALDALRGASSVLEVGCGEGYGAALLAKAFARVTCVDIGADVLERARRATPRSNVEFLRYDGARLPFPDRAFDGLVSFQVIEHVQDPVAFTRELARVLKPGGKAVLTTPSRTYRLDPGQAPWNRFHLREYAAAEFCAVLRTAFATVEVLGIRGSERAQALEHARVRPAREGKRRRPESPPTGWKGLVDRVRKTLRKPAPFGLQDFRVIANDVDRDALDLLATCATAR
jgi:SAM-dependent methyltransferase